VPFHPGLTRAQGDPGFFGTLGRIARGVAGFVGGGGIPGILVRGVTRAIGGRPTRPTPFPVTTSGRQIGGGGRVPQVMLPTGQACPPGMACPKGMRLNKSDYFLTNGTFVQAGTRCVKIRRTNPANSRALSRAQRREAGFMKLALRTGLVRFPKATAVRRKAKK